MDLKELLWEDKVKHRMIVSQEKVLQRVQKDFLSTQETLASKEKQVGVAHMILPVEAAPEDPLQLHNLTQIAAALRHHALENMLL